MAGRAGHANKKTETKLKNELKSQFLIDFNMFNVNILVKFIKATIFLIILFFFFPLNLSMSFSVFFFQSHLSLFLHGSF